MAFQPITITRIDSDTYIVGGVHLLRDKYFESTDMPAWGAYPHGDRTQRPLFTAKNLEEILDMAHGAVEMMRPA
jgi:hypothetical protein